MHFWVLGGKIVAETYKFVDTFIKRGIWILILPNFQAKNMSDSFRVSYVVPWIKFGVRNFAFSFHTIIRVIKESVSVMDIVHKIGLFLLYVPCVALAKTNVDTYI